VTKRKGDFRSKIDSILAEGDGDGAAPVRLATATDETRTDSIEIGKIYLPKDRRPDQDVSELLSSVKQRGVLQPLLLRPVGSRYEVVDGARRLVAAQQTGRTSVPAVVRKLTAAEAKATASKDRPIVARSRAATKTVTASKARAVRKATGRAPAQPPIRAVATAAAAAAPIAAKAVPPASAATPATANAAKSPAATKSPATVKKPESATRPAPKRAAVPQPASPTAGVQIFGDAPPAPTPPIALEPLPPIAAESRPGEVAAPPPGAAAEPVAAASSARPAAADSRIPEHPGQQREAEPSSPSANSVLSLPGRRPSRARAMAGWYVFLAVLFVASFALTNLAINHEASLSLATGGVAGVGLIAVVVILATGR
jgi:hypothetical protein